MPSSSSSQLPPAAEGMAAVVARIQDRAAQLVSERRMLTLVEAEEEEQQTILNDEQEAWGTVRLEYLSAMRSRHGVEEELWKMEEHKKDCLESMEVLQNETQELCVHKETIQADWEELAGNVLVGHDLKREIYRSSIQAHMETREQQLMKRKRQLMAIHQKVDSYRKDTQSAEKETSKLERAVKRLKSTELEEDEDLSNLALRVRETVAKVRPLDRSW